MVMKKRNQDPIYYSQLCLSLLHFQTDSPITVAGWNCERTNLGHPSSQFNRKYKSSLLSS